MESWDHYRTLLAVLTEGSLSGAARALGLAQPTVGRHIEALEVELGTPLFSRSVGGLAPTEAGLALLPYAEAMEAAAAAIVRTASGDSDTVSGTVRIATADVMGVEVLPPILTRFHETYPAVVLELVLSNRQENLARRDADIAVRMVRPEQAAILAKRVGAVRIGLYAHRRYLEANGPPTQIAIGFDRDLQIVRALKDSRISLERDSFVFRSDNDLALLATLRAGFGVGACQAPIARRDPDLIEVLEGAFQYELEVWVAMHEDLKNSRRMRLTFDWLVAELEAYVRS